jgi:uridine kinase
MAYYTKVDCNEKSKNIHNTSKEIVRVYKLRNYINYFYSGMPYSTGALEDFNLVFLSDNKLVLIFNAKSGSKNEYVLYKNVIEQYDIGKKWIKDMDIPYLADVNHLISELKMENLVKAIETNYNNQLSHVAREVLDKKAKYVLIAGPSSSGKTTSTKKLSLQLRSRGYDTLLISADNYFKDIAEHNKPKEEIDFEAIDCLDLKLLGKQLKDLVAGKKVSLPEYNFALGVKEYNDPPVSITDDTIILIEGLHAINDKMTPDLDPSKKFKIFLSPLMPLNIDKHNYISINDLRLMRRIVRDNRTRATDVGQTISYWNIVRNGEEKNIYPFVNGVDRVLNTSLAYEVGVLKVFVLPLLYSVTEESLAYTEARRIIESLDEFYPIPSDYVPDDSILREFIGKSIFESYK